MAFDGGPVAAPRAVSPLLPSRVLSAYPSVSRQGSRYLLQAGSAASLPSAATSLPGSPVHAAPAQPPAAAPVAAAAVPLAAPRVDRPALSWGDPLNFCRVESAELCGHGLLVVTSVVGIVHGAGEAEVYASGRPGLRIRGRAAGNVRPLEDARQGGAMEVCLAFDCPPELQQADDVVFSYAPGYTGVSIMDKILASLAELTPPSRRRLQWEGPSCPKSAQQQSLSSSAATTSLSFMPPHRGASRPSSPALETRGARGQASRPSSPAVELRGARGQVDAHAALHGTGASHSRRSEQVAGHAWCEENDCERRPNSSRNSLVSLPTTPSALSMLGSSLPPTPSTSSFSGHMLSSCSSSNVASCQSNEADASFAAPTAKKGAGAAAPTPGGHLSSSCSSGNIAAGRSSEADALQPAPAARKGSSLATVPQPATAGRKGASVAAPSEDRVRHEPSSKRSSPSRRVPLGVITAAAPRAETLFASVENGHAKSTQALSRQLRNAQAVRAAWEAGDVVALAGAVESSRDEVLAFSLFLRLQQQKEPLSAKSLSKLLPLAQRSAQSDCEDHAVAAIRFVLHALEVSWPSMAKALRQVGTPKGTYDACEEVASRLSSLLATVRAMARSVRVSRTSGPLVPVCRKLKTSLEEALAAASRGRSA